MNELLNNMYFGALNFIARSRILAAVDINEIANGDDAGTFQPVVESITETSKGIYQTLMVVGGFGGVLTLIVAFLYFMIAGNGANKENAKGKIVVVLIGVIGVFAAVFIVGLAQTIGEGMAGQAAPAGGN